MGNTVYRDIRVQVTDERITGVPEQCALSMRKIMIRQVMRTGDSMRTAPSTGKEDYAKTLEETFARSASGTGNPGGISSTDEIAASKAWV